MNQEKFEQVKKLFTLFKESGLSELEVEDESLKISLKKAPEKASQPAKHPLVANPLKTQSVPPKMNPKVEPKKGRTVAIRAPLIGIFYRSSSPDVPAFVDLGDVVNEGQTVCIVEAMKVFNEIKADWSGRVVAIPAEDGTLVQAGDPLIVLEFGSAPSSME